MRIGLIGVGRIGAAYQAELTAVAAGRAASPCTLDDALEAFHVAGACELSRQRNQPVRVAEMRR
jgi:myo-inositol 2-dehydrogenase / D-chiro-inositol 1-dehydrogenase